jgi:tRNA(fMet)-specific endonuclease VapC
MYILDTDLVSLLERGNSKSSQVLRDRVLALPADQIATTVITYEEQMRGWLSFLARSRTLSAQVDAYRRLSRQIHYYGKSIVLPFDEAAAVTFQHLKAGRIRIGTMDLKIASIALSQKATLLSRNLRDFNLVPGLDVQDWSS